LHDKFDEKYGPGLAVSDYSLGVFYVLAVSSLSTYGILLAGLRRLVPQICENLVIYRVNFKKDLN